MHSTRQAYWRRQGSLLSGYGSYGTGTKVTLSIGRKAGIDYGPWREGQEIPVRSVTAAVVDARAAQVGVGDVGLTRIDAHGRYKGKPEPSAKVELIWIKSKKESTPQRFFANVRRLAQEVAGALAQREVIVSWDAPGRRGRVDTATPTRAPSALRRAEFCAWVSRHSRKARLDRSDDCYEELRRRRVRL